MSTLISAEIYLTGILRRKSPTLKAPAPIRNGQLYCQNMREVKMLAKRFNLQYTGSSIEENLKQAYEKTQLLL